ncbi:MAG: methyltransferase domain-containing protein [Pseudomonadota bacterium]
MADKSAPEGLWQPRSVEDTKAIYADWADRYDADVKAWGYVTPARVADALAAHMDDLAAPILDFGCGTGVSGGALASRGFTTLDGTDISAEMLEIARGKGIYRDLWASEAGNLGDFAPGDYAAIAAIGVISAGAAPPETLADAVGSLATGGLLAFSFNDPTFDDPRYMAAVEAETASGRVEIVFREHGPHLPAKEMGSDVFVVRRL